MALHAGLLYSQARALLALPRAQLLVQRIIGALAINGGQRFAAQVGETAGRASLFLTLCMSLMRYLQPLTWCCCIRHARFCVTPLTWVCSIHHSQLCD